MKNNENKNIVPQTNIIADIRTIIEVGRRQAYAAVNEVMIGTYWQIGKRIVEEEQNGNNRAEYGKQLIKNLALVLTAEYGNGFSERYLRSFRQFYLLMPNYEIWKSRFPNLTWTHILTVLRVEDETARRGTNGYVCAYVRRTETNNFSLPNINCIFPPKNNYAAKFNGKKNFFKCKKIIITKIYKYEIRLYHWKPALSGGNVGR